MYPSLIDLGLYGGLVSYGSLTFTVASPPQSFNEPLSLASVQTYLKIDSDDLGNQDMIDELNGLRSAARVEAEKGQGRDLAVKQYDLSLDYWPPYQLTLRAPLRSVDLVQYTDASGIVHALTGGIDYLVDAAKQPGCITPLYNTPWPSFTPARSSSILVRFTSGYSADDPFWQDQGSHLKFGMKRLINDWYCNRLPTNEVPADIAEIFSYGALPRVK